MVSLCPFTLIGFGIVFFVPENHAVRDWHLVVDAVSMRHLLSGATRAYCGLSCRLEALI